MALHGRLRISIPTRIRSSITSSRIAPVTSCTKEFSTATARAVFNGKVFVREGAQKTDAMQTNKNLLLSDKARVDTKPQLEIFADDVKCAHGAAVGRSIRKSCFISRRAASIRSLGASLLTYGFAEEVIGKIKIDSIRSQLDETVLRQLHTSLET